VGTALHYRPTTEAPRGEGPLLRMDPPTLALPAPWGAGSPRPALSRRDPRPLRLHRWPFYDAWEK